MDAPAVAVNRDGTKVAIVWMDMRSGRNNRKLYWSTTSGPDRLFGEARSTQGHPAASFDHQGLLHVAWEDDRSGVRRIHHRSVEGKDVALSPEKGKASFPSLACGKGVGVAYEWGGHVAFAAVQGR